MPKWSQRSGRRACVVGLDGVPYSMLQRFMDAGVTPRLRDLAARGRMASMTVSLPEISSVSWTTFMTGRNPGTHGIYGFTDLHEGTYKTSFPSFRDVKTETIWDRLGAANMRSVVINQPATYPARPIHGALVSGFVAVHLDRSVFPAKYLKTAREVGYEIDLDAAEVRGNPPALFGKLHELLGMRRRMLEALWKAEKWNLMEVVVTGTDRLHHFIWDAYEDPSHAHHGDFLDYYRAVDAFVGDVADRFAADGGGENFFVLSDHGFCGTQKEVYLNTFLAENGYLVLGDAKADALGAISERATAFCLDPARIYIHRRGRFPRGSVAPADVAPLKAEIKARIEALRDGDEPVVRHVFDGAEVYFGPEADRGPDLLVVPRNGYDCKGRIGAPGIFGERRLQGMHTWDDAFFLTLRADLLPQADNLNLVDVPARVLQSLEVDLG
ncbi:MAG: alkaline phosphatase family protein [Candidatus Krumholzibacteria bacterium]|nr:alkaline phosphatase family protein [Candidatus Krumholzibacteria bacterium]